MTAKNSSPSGLAVLYARYSSTNQRQESAMAQLRKAREYCESKGYVIIREYVDEAETGTTTENREAFLQMISDARCKEFGVVVFHKLDRSARDEYDYYHFKAQMKKHGVRIEYADQHIDDSPEGAMMEAFLVGMAAYYSRNLGREVKKGQKENALRAQHVGGLAPLGYDVDPSTKKYVVNPTEARAVQQIFQMRSEGAGYTKIILWLNNNGYKTKRGKTFGKNSIHEILRNKKYIGTYIYGRVPQGRNDRVNNHAAPSDEMIEIPNALPAIVSMDLWDKVQARLNADKHNGGAYTAKETYLLSGFIRCACGSSMSGTRVKAKGEIYAYYQCAAQHRKKAPCDVLRIRKEIAEAAVLNAMEDALFSPKAIERLIDTVNMEMDRLLTNSAAEKADLAKKISAAKKKIENLLDLAENGEIDDLLRKRLKENQNIIYAATSRIDELDRAVKLYASGDMIRSMLSGLTTKEKTPDEIRGLLEAFIGQITVSSEKLEITFKFCPSVVAPRGIEPLTPP